MCIRDRRNAGITKKILVLGVSDVHAVSLAIERKVTCTVASLEWIDLLLQSNIDVAGLAVHIKIDSGMGRIGFRDSQDAQEAIHRLEKAGAVSYTHLRAHETRHDLVCRLLLEKKKKIKIDKLHQNSLEFVLKQLGHTIVAF